MQEKNIQDSYNLLLNFEHANWDATYLKNTGEVVPKCCLSSAGRIVRSLCLKSVVRKLCKSDQEAGIQKINQALEEVFQSTGIQYDEKKRLLESVVEQIGLLDEKVSRYRKLRLFPALLEPETVVDEITKIPSTNSEELDDKAPIILKQSIHTEDNSDSYNSRMSSFSSIDSENLCSEDDKQPLCSEDDEQLLRKKETYIVKTGSQASLQPTTNGKTLDIPPSQEHPRDIQLVRGTQNVTEAQPEISLNGGQFNRLLNSHFVFLESPQHAQYSTPPRRNITYQSPTTSRLARSTATLTITKTFNRQRIVRKKIIPPAQPSVHRMQLRPRINKEKVD